VRSFRSLVRPVLPRDRADAIGFAFRRSEVLVFRTEDDAGFGVPTRSQLEELDFDLRLETYVGELDDADLIAWELDPEVDAPEGWTFEGVRALYGLVDEQLFTLAGRAVQLIEWRRNHQFCGRCGAPTELLEEERATRCTNCGLVNYPRISPAVIMLVEKDGQCLLARGHNFQTAFYSCLAGFVEPGETLEDAVHREVREETGIEITDVTYFGSQPWPFPNSLMIGFTAKYAGGIIELEDAEIADARWFSPDDMPLLPGKISIARRLIDDFLARNGAEVES
jgi:NAD+ diphosphatase